MSEALDNKSRPRAGQANDGRTREERLKAALKANMQRRKEQARSRAAEKQKNGE